MKWIALVLAYLLAVYVVCAVMGVMNEDFDDE